MSNNFKQSPDVPSMEEYLADQGEICEICVHATVPLEEEPCKSCKYGGGND